MRTILSLMALFEYVLPVLLPEYRYIMNPQMHGNDARSNLETLNRNSLESNSSKTKHAQDPGFTVYSIRDFFRTD